MSTFCASCGTATGGGKFCPKCGAPQGATAPDSGPSISQTAYTPQPVRRKSPVLKIVLIVVGVFLILCGIAVVKGYYFLKDTVHEAKQQYAESKMGPAEETHAGCDLLNKETVARVVGVPVAAIKGNQAGEMREYCNYLSAANLTAQKSSDEDADAEKESKDKEPSWQDLESIAKKVGDAGKNRPLLGVQIFRGNGAVAVFGIKTASRIAGNGAHNVPGPWDEAYFGPNDTAFVVRKGRSAILIELNQVEQKRDTGITLAKEMVYGI
jgi:hypothetical protein